ncbi:hypothetical protein ACLOJK_034805, partial [Asimina triloba]
HLTVGSSEALCFIIAAGRCLDRIIQATYFAVRQPLTPLPSTTIRLHCLPSSTARIAFRQRRPYPPPLSPACRPHAIRPLHHYVGLLLQQQVGKLATSTSAWHDHNSVTLTTDVRIDEAAAFAT